MNYKWYFPQIWLLQGILCGLEELCEAQLIPQWMLSESAKGEILEISFYFIYGAKMDCRSWCSVHRMRELGNQERVTIGQLRPNQSTCSRTRVAKEDVPEATGKKWVRHHIPNQIISIQQLPRMNLHRLRWVYTE